MDPSVVPATNARTSSSLSRWPSRFLRMSAWGRRWGMASTGVGPRPRQGVESGDGGQEAPAVGRQRHAESLRDRGADVGEAGAGIEIDPGGGGGSEGEERHVLARMIGARE